jgi:hypothetical protein
LYSHELAGGGKPDIFPSPPGFLSIEIYQIIEPRIKEWVVLNTVYGSTCVSV